MDEFMKGIIGSMLACCAVFAGTMGTANYISQKNPRETKKSLVSNNPEMTLIKKETVHVPDEHYYHVSMMHLSHSAYDYTRLYFDTDGNLETPEIYSYHRVLDCPKYEEHLKTMPIGTKKTYKEWDSELACPHKKNEWLHHWQNYATANRLF